MIAILIAIGFVAGIFILWLTTKEECVKTPTPPPPPSPPVGGGHGDTGKSASHDPHEKEKNEHHHGTSWKEIFATLGFAALVCWFGKGCLETGREWAKESQDAKVVAAQKAADPDQHLWKLWKVDSAGQRKWLADGIRRETSKLDGRVILSWRADFHNGEIRAEAIPRKTGHWEVVGKSIRKDFVIYTVSNTEIHGHFCDLDEDYDFVMTSY